MIKKLHQQQITQLDRILGDSHSANPQNRS